MPVLYKEEPISLQYNDGRPFNIQVLRVDGLGEQRAINRETAPPIKSDLVLNFGYGFPKDTKVVCLDLNDARYGDEQCLSTILVHNRLRKNSGVKYGSVITNAAAIERLMTMSQVDTVIDTFKSVDEMVKHYQTLLSEDSA